MAQASTRFALSVHILTLLARHRGEALTSARIAESAGATPAFIRRILCDLARAGLTAGRHGKGGGAVLARGPKRISLMDIYRAVERDRLVPAPKEQSGKKADAGSDLSQKLPRVLGGAVDEAEAAFFAALDGVSLKQVLKAVA